MPVSVGSGDLQRCAGVRPAEAPRRLVPLPRGADHGDARRRVMVFRAAGRRLRLRAAGRPDLGRGSPSCRATASGSAGCRAGWPTRSGSTTRTSTSPTTCAGRRCRGRAPTSSSRARRPDPEPAARPEPPALGDVPRRGAARTGSRSSPRPTTRWSTASLRSTSARSSLDGDRPTRERRRRHVAARPGAAAGSSWSPARSPTPCARPTQVVDTVRGGVAEVRATAGRASWRAGGLLAAAARGAARPAPDQPAQRR